MQLHVSLFKEGGRWGGFDNRREDNMTTEAGIRVMCPQAKESKQPLGAGRGEEQILLTAARGNSALLIPDLRPVELLSNFSSPELWENRFLLL